MDIDIMNVKIVTKSLDHSLHDGKCLRSRAGIGDKTLRVDLSGENEVHAGNQFKLHMNAKALTESKGRDVITARERCELFRQHVFLRISEYPDDIDSLCLTDGVVNAIFVVFTAMRRCERIIINCKRGQNRAPMVGARLAALIGHGINEPCDEAYEYYLQLCKHLNTNFAAGSMNTWPNICTNDWTQMAICVFGRSEGRKYHSGRGKIHIDHPQGELSCIYNDYDSDVTEPIDISDINRLCNLPHDE